MKRIVVLIDGTWNKEGITGDTNVATLDRPLRTLSRSKATRLLTIFRLTNAGERSPKLSARL